MSAPGMGWEYIAHKQGEAIAASDGDTSYDNLRAALIACVAEMQAAVSGNGGSDGE
jgi:hypothetical protein